MSGTDALPLFAQAYRSTDPQTSAIAAEKVTSGGRRLSHCTEIVGVLVRQNVSDSRHALTFAEIAYLLDWPHDRAHKRMKDCQRCGPWNVNGSWYQVRCGPARTCVQRGTQCQTYYVEEGGAP